MKVLTINGTELEVPQAVTTVRELLTHLELDRKVVIVELNRNILEKKSAHAEALLSNGDRVEIVHFVGGG